MNRILCIGLLPAGLFVAGCASSSVRVVMDSSSMPQAVAVPDLTRVADSPDEPRVCLFSVQPQRDTPHPINFARAGRFRSVRVLTSQNPDPGGCGVLVSIRVSGNTVYGTSYVDVYSPGGTPVMQAQAEGKPGPYFGYQSAAKILKVELQSGRRLRERLASLSSAETTLAPEGVVDLAGGRLIDGPALERLMSNSSHKVDIASGGWHPLSGTRGARTAPPAVPLPRSAAAAEPRSDLDDLPAPRSARKAHAVVVGVERYRESLPKAEFAARDARLAAEYFKRALGVPEANLALLLDDRATKSDFEKYFERWLPNRVEDGDEVYVYFSGHGAPSPAKGNAYLVPFDGDPTYIEQTGYPVAKLYAHLSKLPAGRVVVAMDSCFSGAGGRSVLAKGARPLVSVVSAALPAKVTVLSASAGDQIANSYREKGHGLFTYFLLKGLKEKGADFKAAFNYLKPEVARIARREYNADQDPQWREGK